MGRLHGESGVTSSTLKGWVQLSRPPFHLVGIFPFVLGSILSFHLYGTFNLSVFLLGIAAVVLIMLSTYYNGEFYDMKEDRLSAELERNTFSGGSQAILKKLLVPEHARIGGYVTIALAVVLGLILQFYYKTGAWTIFLGTLGIFAGFFYSAPPFRWVQRGVGELLIGFCYGWLPVAVSFYLQTGSISGLVNWISIPVAATIFNVILINEFPDYPADVMVDKRNLVVRMGKEKAVYLYVAMTILTWVAYFLSVKKGVPSKALLFFSPFFLISFVLSVLMLRKKYLNRKMLEVMCGLTIVVNLGTSLSYILAIWLKGQ